MEELNRQLKQSPEENAKEIAKSEAKRDGQVMNRHDRRAAAAIERLNARLRELQNVR